MRQIFNTVLILLFFHNIIIAQQYGNSPYSQFGLGDINPSGFNRNLGMAGAGGAAVNSNYINIINPAMLGFRNGVTYEFGLGGGFKNSQTKASSENTGNLNLSYIAIALPMLTKYKNKQRFNRWVSSVGITPFSSTNYKINYRMGVNSTDTANVTISGNGNINKVFWASGFQINKNLSLGLENAFLFGPVTSTIQTGYSSTDAVESFERINRTDYILKPAITYRKLIGGVRDTANNYLHSGKTLSFSAFYELFTNIKSSNFYSLKRVNPTTLSDLRTDTIVYEEKNATNIPQNIGFALAIENYNQSNLPWWTIACDFNYQPWSKFATNGSMANSWSVKLGGEISPVKDMDKSFFNKFTYRGGIYYSHTPYLVNNVQIIEKGIALGFAFQIPKSMAQANFSAKLGLRGNKDYVQEKFINLNFGVNINDIWFIKRRIN